MRALLVLLFGAVTCGAGFVGGALVAIQLHWGERARSGEALTESPMGATQPRTVKAGREGAPAAPAGLTEEESIRWKKLRAQLDGYWVFLRESGGSGEWKVYKMSPHGADTDILAEYCSRMPLTDYQGYVSMNQEGAECAARRLITKPSWGVAAVVDFNGKDFPRVACWFRNDGSSTNRFTAPPKVEYGSSLQDFLTHLH